MAPMPRKTYTEIMTLVIRPPHMTAAEFQSYVFGVRHVSLDCKMQSIHEAACQVDASVSSRDIRKVLIMIFNHSDDAMSNVMQRWYKELLQGLTQHGSDVQEVASALQPSSMEDRASEISTIVKQSLFRKLRH